MSWKRCVLALERHYMLTVRPAGLVAEQVVKKRDVGAHCRQGCAVQRQVELEYVHPVLRVERLGVCRKSGMLQVRNLHCQTGV